MEQQAKEPISEYALMEQLQAQLRPVFKNLPHEIPLLLFTRSGKNEPFSHATRFLIRAVREVCPKISLREYDLSHDMAKNAGNQLAAYEQAVANPASTKVFKLDDK